MTTFGKALRTALILTLLLGLAHATRAAETAPPTGNATEEIVAPAQADQSVDSALQREVQGAWGEASRLRRELEALKKEYEGWKALNARTIEVKSSNDRLSAEIEATRAEVQVLKSENDKATSRRNLYWFFSGAAVLAFGLILGLALGGAKRRNQGGYRF